MNPAERWFKHRGLTPLPFQREVWGAVERGESGLLHATTGSGKTLAVWMGALNVLDDKAALPLGVLWITPMRALAADTARALAEPLVDLGLRSTVGARTGDTGSAERARQNKRFPTALVTTPESLTLLLTQPDASRIFANLRLVVVDEWHELLGNKRGVQTQLALARLRHWRPHLMTWGLSATLSNLPYALEVLVPQGGGQLVQGVFPKRVTVDTLLPASVERFPWAGHLGMKMLPQVVRAIDESLSTLVFTNTRSQSEVWYQALLESRPDWAGAIALHHGSIDAKSRDWVELGLKEGRLKAVVCTSSLDLGVDFLPVDRVLQIGSPKSVARLMQRAGRSGHEPGRLSRVTLVPTHSLELVESAAVQDALSAGHIEARRSPHKPLDVLVQHLVTAALGGGFLANEMREEVLGTYAYRDLTEDQWRWALGFVERGGGSLDAYPDYRRAIPDDQGMWHVPDNRLARRHRMGVGTIVSDASIAVKFFSTGGAGKALGSVEESFIARLTPGDHLMFGGRVLELVRVQDMTAYVRLARAKTAAIPRWNGGRLPLSAEMSNAIVSRLERAGRGDFAGPEMKAVQPLLELQARWSALPSETTLVGETLQSRDGSHLFLYPFAGRTVHLGLASLLGARLAKMEPRTFSVSINQYGFELLSPVEIDWTKQDLPALLDPHNLLEDVTASLNATELARRRFREIARISGLVFNGFPGAPKSARQVQASSSLFYDVFRRHDPQNLLLRQAEAEVLQFELDFDRLRDALIAIRAKSLDLRRIERPTPFSFPLIVERFRESVSSEKVGDRISRMVADLEKAAAARAEGKTL